MTEAGLMLTGANKGQAELAGQRGIRGIAAEGSLVANNGIRKCAGVVTGVAFGFGDECGAVAEVFRFLQAAEGVSELFFAKQGKTVEEPCGREAGIELTGAREQVERFFEAGKVIELEYAEFEMGLGVVGSFEKFLAAEFAVETVFGGALFGANGEPEVVDHEIGGGDRALLLEKAGTNALVDAS